MELRRAGRALVVGHRGAAALAPENSLEAIEAAAAVGADAVELDVLREGDSLVLAHESGAGGAAQTLDAGLALSARLGLAVQIDVKSAGTEAGVVAALRRHDLLERSFVSTSSQAWLAAFAALEPALPRSYTYPEDRRGLSGRPGAAPMIRVGLTGMRALLPYRLPRLLAHVGASAATLDWRVVSPRVVSACHRAGAAVYVWTVNDRERAKKLVADGADAIITDDPRILLADPSSP